MSKRDWFRQEKWTPEVRKEFFQRLDRARPQNRAQYLRIQAVHLARVGEHEGALELLELQLSEYPDRLETAASEQQRGQSFEALGQSSKALIAYRASLNAMREFPGARVDSHLDFAELVLRLELADLFEEALTKLEEFDDQMAFPMQVYRFAAAKALLLEKSGRSKEATLYARRALRESQRKESGFRYHRRLGLVDDPDPGLQRELERLAE